MMRKLTNEELLIAVQNLTDEEIFALDWSTCRLGDKSKAWGRVYAVNMARWLSDTDPDACRRFNKETLLAVGFVFVLMNFHRSRYGLPVSDPVRPAVPIAITLAQPEFKNLKRDKFCHDFNEIVDLLDLQRKVHE